MSSNSCSKGRTATDSLIPQKNCFPETLDCLGEQQDYSSPDHSTVSGPSKLRLSCASILQSHQSFFQTFSLTTAASVNHQRFTWFGLHSRSPIRSTTPMFSDLLHEASIAETRQCEEAVRLSHEDHSTQVTKTLPKDVSRQTAMCATWQVFSINADNSQFSTCKHFLFNTSQDDCGLPTQVYSTSSIV